MRAPFIKKKNCKIIAMGASTTDVLVVLVIKNINIGGESWKILNPKHRKYIL